MKRNFVVSLFGSLVGFGTLLILLSATSIAGARGADFRSDVTRTNEVSASTPLTSTFTYQGQLKNGGAVVNGSCDMAFRLYDDPLAGNLISTSPITSTMLVSNGLFTIGLNFGANAFDGKGLWLDIQVNCNNSGFVPLSRQALTAAPYALFATSAGALQNYPVTTTQPSNGQVLKFNNGEWTPGTDNTGVGGSGWSLTGNSGTTSADFLGTTDNMSLTLAVSGTAALRIIQNATSPNIIGGYSGNFISPMAVGGTIGGGGASGYINSVSGNYGTISGGQYNTVISNNATIGGGYSNTVGAAFSTVGGGYSNTASALTGDSSTVAGGWQNIASNNNATVGGGGLNAASGDSAVASGGYSNTASGLIATVSGGMVNRASARGATVSGGYSNNASSWDATVSGGGGNTVSNTYGTVGGGQLNTASGYGATVSGGGNNIASGNNWATVSGGGANLASGGSSVIGGGDNNTASNVYATVGGGYNNIASKDFATVSGGGANTASGYGASISGGGGNAVTGYIATVGGGYSNTASYTYTVVGGGTGNTASGYGTTVGGGGNNTASGNNWATISGGGSNLASGGSSVIGGGDNNTASNVYATIGGGYLNVVNGTGATVSGGYSNTATGDFSIAAGYKAWARYAGSFVWNDAVDSGSPFADSQANQFNVRSSGGVRFFTSDNYATGCVIAAGGGSWSCTSDRNAKSNFANLDGREILAQLNNIPIQTWNYKTQDASIRHIGPMAQDFYAAFNVGEDNKRISTVDEEGVALAAIQGLYQIVQDKDKQITAQQKQIDVLQTQVSQWQPGTSTPPFNVFNLISVAALVGFGWMWLQQRRSKRGQT